MIEITIPAQGVAMEEAVLLRWLKQPGDAVAAGDPVAEIETDKATIDLESPVDGVLGLHLAAEGDAIAVGVAVVRVLDPGEAEPADASSAAPSAEGGAGSASAPVSAAPAADPATPRRLSPRARALLAAADHAQPEEGAAEGRFRAKVAARVTESWRTIPHFAVTREVRADALLARLEQLRAQVPQLTATDLLLRALASAVGSDEIGLAVATEHGVTIPVIRDALREDLAGLAADRRAAVERARAGRMSVEDQGTPLTTLSNLGPMGVDSFTGIVALGQQSLLTIGRARPRVVATDDGPAIHTTFHATLNVDHRLLDGADAATLLDRFTSTAEAPAPSQRGAA